MDRLIRNPFIKKVIKIKLNLEKNKYNLPFLVRVVLYIPFAYLDILKVIFKYCLKIVRILFLKIQNSFEYIKQHIIILYKLGEKKQIQIYKILNKDIININLQKKFRRKKNINKDIKNTYTNTILKSIKHYSQKSQVIAFTTINRIKTNVYIELRKLKKLISIIFAKLKLLPKLLLLPVTYINIRREKLYKAKKNKAKKPKPENKNVNVKERKLNLNFNKRVQKILNIEIVYLIFLPIILVFRLIRLILNFELKIKIFSFKTFFVICIIFTLYVLSVVYFSVLKDIPDAESINKYDPRLTTNIYDRKGNLLYKVYQDEDRTLVQLEDIPSYIINATLAIEDASFYEHSGLSTKGIARAAKKTYFEDDIEGGSTITQQLVKNILLSPERTYERKIKEAVLSVEVERRFSKDEILEMYLNKISYGGTAYGVRSASNKYFNKELNDLSLAEASYLAGLPAAPTKYSPFGSSPELGKVRQYEVLRRMVELGYVSASEAQEAYLSDLEFNDNAEFMKAPHFVNYVISELEGKYGQKLVSQGGLDVYTSLDLELQNKLEKVVIDKVWEFGSNNVTNGAVIVTDPHTGEILAMVGSIDYWDTTNDGNVNVTVSPRQPGSSIKPLMYALAFESGYSPTYKINDSPITYPIAGQRPYSPVNYDGRFHGVVTIKQALANSYNVPAVKMLEQLGVNEFITFAEKIGITTWEDRSRFGLSLTLGAGEVRMIDMAQAYGVFANNGKYQKVNPILKIYDPYGNVIEENGCVDLLKESPSILTKKKLFEVQAIASSDYAYRLTSNDTCIQKQVIKESTAFYLSDILSDNSARAPAFGTQSNLYIPEKQVAVKSGTTQNLKDNWAVGYTNDYVVVAWIGNNDGDLMKNVVSGYRGASNIWRDTFDVLISDYYVNDKIERPSNIIEVEICPYTNTLTCSGCPSVKQYFVKGEEPTEKCSPSEVKRILEEIEKQNKKDEEDKDEKNEEA